MALNDSSCINNHRYSVFGAAFRDVLKKEKHPPAILSDLNSCTIELHFLMEMRCVILYIKATLIPSLDKFYAW